MIKDQKENFSMTNSSSRSPLEQILRQLKGYDSCNTLLLPPRHPGEKLPPELYEYFKEMKKSKEDNGEHLPWRTLGPSPCPGPSELPLNYSVITNQLQSTCRVPGAFCILIVTLTKRVLLSPCHRCKDWGKFCSC